MKTVRKLWLACAWIGAKELGASKFLREQRSYVQVGKHILEQSQCFCFKHLPWKSSQEKHVSYVGFLSFTDVLSKGLSSCKRKFSGSKNSEPYPGSPNIRWWRGGCPENHRNEMQEVFRLHHSQVRWARIPTWRIIPVCKWLIIMVSKSPK